MFVGGWDNGRNTPLLYRVDPAGVCVGIKGYAVGFKGNEINSQLVQKKGEFGTVDNAVKIGLSLYQKYVSTSMNGDDVEVWTGDAHGFRKISAQDVDNLLENLRVE